MSLKKKVFLGLGATYWLSSSFAVFLATADTPPNKRDAVEKTLGRRLAMVAAGPVVWNMAGPVASGAVAYGLVTDPKATMAEYKKQVRNFLTDSPKKR
jgi:hypothetical protein